MDSAKKSELKTKRSDSLEHLQKKERKIDQMSNISNSNGLSMTNPLFVTSHSSQNLTKVKKKEENNIVDKTPQKRTTNAEKSNSLQPDVKRTTEKSGILFDLYSFSIDA